MAKGSNTELIMVGTVGIIAILGLVLLFMASAGLTGRAAYQSDSLLCLERCDANWPAGTAVFDACQQDCLPFVHHTPV